MADRATPQYIELFGGSSTPLDPVNSANIVFSKYDPTNETNILKIGRVVDCWPKQQCCLVQASFSIPTVCFFDTSSASPISGVTRVSIPQLGQFVQISCNPEGDFGQIISAYNWQNKTSIPSHGIAISGEYLPDFEQMRDAKEFFTDDIALDGNNGVTLEQSLPGEEYALNEHNVGYILSKLFLRLQAGNMVSATFHWTDQLLDLFAHNFKMGSSGFRAKSLCDYGRTSTEIGFSPILKDFVNDQNIAETIKILAGWFGNGLTLYSQNKNGPDKPGSSIWMDDLGTLAFRSQVGCWMSKVNGIYVPKRLKEVDDIKGEGDKNISDPAPRLPFDIAKSSSPMGFGCQARDYVAWLTSGKYQFERFKAYEKDWSKVEAGLATSRGLGGEFYAQFPEVIELTSAQESIEDTNRFRPGDAFCGTLPDGSAVMRDAWGSSIELRGGHIIITNAKDTQIISGRNTVILSGNDAIVRSQNNCDITVTNNDVRIKTGKNILVDSKKGSIQLSALNTPAPKTDGLGKEYQSTGITLITNGSIEAVGKKFQASLSDRFVIEGRTADLDPTVWIKSQSSLFWSKNGHYFAHGDNADEFIGMNSGRLWTSGNIATKGDLTVYGAITTDGYITAGKSIACNDFIASSNNGPDVGSLLEAITPLEEFDPGEGLREHFELNNWNEDIRAPYKTEDYDRIKFYNRTVEDYKTGDAVWFESFWQRQYKDGLKAWDTSEEEDERGEYPYPGKAHHDGSKRSWVTYKEVNVELDGTPKTPESQTNEGGVFSPESYTSQLFHI